MELLDDQTLTRLAESFALPHFSSHWPATHGVENRNFFLSPATDEPGGEYVLTIMQQRANSGPALAELLEACVAGGLPVAAPRRTREGAFELQIDGRPVMLCPRLPGRHILNPSPVHIAAVGRFLARLHTRSGALAERLPDHPRNVQWLRSRAAECLQALPWLSRDLLTDALSAVESLLTRSDVAALPMGVIHGDLFRDNVLFDHWGLSGVLDFHHAARGHFVFDIAVAANDWCTQADGSLDQELFEALLNAYHALRPFQTGEIWHLPMFMVYAALAFWLSRIVGWMAYRHGHSDRANDPRAFERIVRQRLTNLQANAPRPWMVDQNLAASDW